METINQASSSHRRRPNTSHTPRLQRSGSSDTGKRYSVNSASWSSIPDNTPLSTTKYQLRQTAVASPSNTPLVSTPPTSQLKGKGKQSADIDESGPPPNTISSIFQSSHSPLGPSMLSSSSYKSVNLNPHISDRDSSEPPRLITYTKHSQGFTWNDELFLPSYLVSRHRYGGGSRSNNRRHRIFDDDDMMGGNDDMDDFDEQADKCPVTDIFVTDEEAAAMMP